MNWRAITLLSILAFARSGIAEDVATTKVSAQAFGDYYWVLSHHHDDLEGRNGFWFRRIFLTVDQTLSPSLSARLRFEASQPGDFTSATSMQPFVKDAWVRWHRSDRLNLIVGISPEPLVQGYEDFWGYRSLEKSPLDLQRIANPRDLGVAIAGRLSPKVRYHAMAGNGSGVGTEVNSGKQVSALIGIDPTAAWTVELGAERNEIKGESRSTAQALAGWRHGSSRAGVFYAHHSRRSGDFDLVSAFAVYAASAKLAAVARIDHMLDPNPEGEAIPYLPIDPARKATIVMGGADCKLHKSFGLIPNVEWVHYDGHGGDDLIPRVTFYYSF